MSKEKDPGERLKNDEIFIEYFKKYPKIRFESASMEAVEIRGKNYTAFSWSAPDDLTIVAVLNPVSDRFTIVEYRIPEKEKRTAGQPMDTESESTIRVPVLNSEMQTEESRFTSPGSQKWVCVSECMQECDCGSYNAVCWAAWYAGCISGCA